jgi:hypothetical protein
LKDGVIADALESSLFKSIPALKKRMFTPALRIGGYSGITKLR